MKRRLVVASAMAVVVSAVFLPGSGVGSSVSGRYARALPAGLAKAIHARLGPGAIRLNSAALAVPAPELGLSVSLSADGTTALVGADGASNGKGAAYIFHVPDAGSWGSTGMPTAKLMNTPGPTTKQYFGNGVALSADGTTAAIGAPLAGGGDGLIYMFHVAAEDAWVSSSTPMATLRVSDGLLGFGLALSPDGTTLITGAPYYDFLYGGAYVFHVASEDAWASTSTPTATLSYANESPDDAGVGWEVALSGDGKTALLSDFYNPNGGGAFVYHVSAEDAWASTTTPDAILSDASIAGSDVLGSSVALSSDGRLALLGNDGANSHTGAVDVFHTSDAAAWASTSAPTATLTKAGGTANARFGGSVAVSSDGTTAFIGADGVGNNRGAAYIFRVADEGSWVSSSTPTATLTNSSGHAQDYLGYGLALSADGATGLAGASGVRFDTGAADVVHVSDASSWASTSTPTAILTVNALNRCVVPKLKGMKVLAAKAALVKRSCRLGTVSRVVHAGGTRGRIFFQSRPPGTRPPVGTKVNVKVKK
ncbi:MAG: hypothetical protein QOG85_2383 [Gaiellaceae bacterium]|jgi:hypothetical protein|nr:hypothetical protein [Gaiellaceae bacterium]